MLPRSAPSFEERVGRVLVEGGFLTRLQLTQVQEASRILDTGLLDTLVFSRKLTLETLVTVLSFQLGIPVVDLSHTQVDPEAVRLVPEEYARKNVVLPLGFDTDGSLRIAAKMPNNFTVAAELFSMTGHQIKFLLALGGRLEDAINRIYATYAVGLALAEKTTLHKVDPPTLLYPDVTDFPAVWVTEMVIGQAMRSGTSEVRLVPDSDSAWVLFRLDGVLQKMAVLPLTLHQNMISRIKVQAGMDIAETTRPQDGTFSMTLEERKVDFHVSCTGITYGEMMVIRILG